MVRAGPCAWQAALVGFTWPSRRSCAGPCRLRSVPVRSASLRSGSLDFPAPSSAFTVSGVALEVFRRVAPLRRPFRSDSAGLLPGLRPRSAPRLGSDRAAALAVGGPICLSWALFPSIDVACGVHSRRAARESPWLRRREAPASAVPFRPRRFTRPRRLAPPAGSRACCIPLPILGLRWGSPRFCADRLATWSREGSDLVPIATCLAARTPLEGAPSIPAVPRHRGLLPPWPCTDARAPTLTFEALLRNPGL